MAEIKIEKKTPIWPWVLLIGAIIAVLIYFLYFNDGDDSDDDNVDAIEQTTEDYGSTEQDGVNNSTVISYVEFISGDPDAMGLDHAFTNSALLQLTNATSAMADEIDFDIKKDLDEVRNYARKIESDPFESTHANSISKAAEILADVLQNIQQQAFPGLASEVNEVKTAASDIEPDVLTLDQKEDVKNFFRASADLLDKMNNNSPQM